MRAWLVLAIVSAAAAPAAAGGGVTMFPLSAGKLPTALAKAPAKMTAALAHAIDAEVANVPIEDAAGLLDCDPEATSCIEAVSKSVKTKRIVFGSVTADEDGVVKVTLTRFDPGPDRQQQTFELVSTTADGMAEELARVSAPLFGKAVKPMVSDKPDLKDPKDPKDPIDEPPHKDSPHGGIGGTTYGILAGGALVTGVGVVFLVQANGIADDVRTAPRDTPTDFLNLTALENKGRTRQRIGGVLTGVGVLALGYGIYRAITEHSAPAHETGAMVSPVPIEGGAAIVVTMGLR
jgi:hypothetical protein